MNRKLSSFESINAKDINKDLTYVSAVQKLSDGSYKNINIPLAQLSGLWNDDVQTAVANAEIDGASIDADVIHQAALNAVENALADAREAVNNAINTANALVGDVATGNTAAQIALREAQEQINQAITEGQATVASMQTMYAQYFGDNGEVRQALNEANRDLSNAHALLTSAQNDLQALTNGEITPESLHEISNTVNGLKTMWGIQGTYVNDENTIANKVLDYVDIAIGKKNFEMTNINGETLQVTKFQDFVDCANGMYQKTLQNMNAAEDRVREMGEEWDAVKGEMSQYVKTSDFSDPNNSTLKSAVKKMTDSLISQTVRDVSLEVVETVRFPVNTNPGEVRRVQRALDKETYYYMSWDKADGDEVIPLNYQFKIKISSSIPNYSDADWQELTLDGVNSPTVVELDGNNEAIPDENDRYLYIQYNGAAQLTEAVDVKVCVQKYLTQSQLSQTAEGIVASAIRSLKNGGELSNLTLTPEAITATVANYLNSNEFKGTELGMTADRINATVLEYLKDGNNYRTLQSIIESTKDSINQSVADYSLELVEEFADDNSLDANHKITTTFSIDNSGTFSDKARVTANLEKGHTYFMKCVCIDTIYYKFGNAIQINSLTTLDNASNGWIKVTNPESIRLDISSDAASSVLTFFIKIKKDNNSQYLSGYSVQLFESVTSKMANFKITADQITEAITGQTGTGDDLVKHIYNRIATAEGANTLFGNVSEGLVKQSTLNSTAETLRSEMNTIATGGNVNNPFVLKSVFDQTVEKIESDVSRVEYIDIENIGDAEYSVKYDGISYGRANAYNSSTLNNYGTFQKGPVFNLSPTTNTNWNGTIFCKLKIPNANTDYTLFLHSSDYRITELYFINADTTNSNFKIAANCVYSESIEGSKLEPLHFGTSKIGFLAIVIKNANDDYTPTYNAFGTKPFTVKFGIPNSVAISNIKQTADSITSQVSDYDSVKERLRTAEQKLTPEEFTSVIAEEVDGKLAGYSTILQTKDFIASTVGAAGVVTNKFNDPLFKNKYGHWHKRYNEYPDYSNIANVVNPAANVYVKYYTDDNDINKSYQINSSNVLEKDLKSFIIYDNNPPSSINGSSVNNRRHVYGLYTNLKVTSGNKYTASFYIKLPAIFGTTSVFDVTNPSNSIENKVKCAFQNIMLNVGFVDELAKLTPHFYITLLNMQKSFEETENIKYTIIDGEEVNWSSEDVYSTQGDKKAYKFNNQGNLTGNGFNDGSVDGNQFGLWIKFGEGNLLNYLNSAFRETMLSDGIDSLNIRYRWFKIWFTFEAGSEYYKSGNSLTKRNDSLDRSFCFEPWINAYQVYTNTYACSKIFCEFAAPMLNSGTTPLKFSSQEKSNEIYSAISQTKDQIDLSINNVRQGLLKVGITIDAEDSERSTIKLNADVLEGDISNARFTGNIEAKSFKVQPQGTDSSISLVIYDPNDTSFVHKYITDHNATLDINAGTPVLVSTVGNDVYLINLTKINNSNDITYYFKIRTDIPITTRNIGYSTASGDSISGFEIKPVKFFSKNVYKLYLDKYIAESIVETKEALITLNNVNSASFYTDLNCGNVKFNYNIFTSEDPKKAISRELGFGSDKPYIETTGVIKYSVNNVEKPIKDIAISNITKSVNSINYFYVNSPVFERDSSEIISIFRIDTTVGSNGYLNNNLYVREVGKLKRFKVYKNIDSSGSLINLQHINPNKPNEPSASKYCYAIECTDSKTGKIFYQILGFRSITQYFGDLTNSDNSSGIIYEVERSTPDGCFAIADTIIRECLSIECSIDKTLNDNTLNGSYGNARVFFNRDECTKLEDRLQRGFTQAIHKANLSSSIYDRKIIVVG